MRLKHSEIIHRPQVESEKIKYCFGIWCHQVIMQCWNDIMTVILLIAIKSRPALTYKVCRNSKSELKEIVLTKIKNFNNLHFPEFEIGTIMLRKIAP